jgi:hypothetical protein
MFIPSVWWEKHHTKRAQSYYSLARLFDIAPPNLFLKSSSEKVVYSATNHQYCQDSKEKLVRQ